MADDINNKEQSSTGIGERIATGITQAVKSGVGTAAIATVGGVPVFALLRKRFRILAIARRGCSKLLPHA